MFGYFLHIAFTCQTEHIYILTADQTLYSIFNSVILNCAWIFPSYILICVV